MNNELSSLTEIQQVEFRLGEWREKLKQAQSNLAVTKNEKFQREIDELVNKIALAEKWLAEQRASKCK